MLEQKVVLCPCHQQSSSEVFWGKKGHFFIPYFLTFYVDFIFTYNSKCFFVYESMTTAFTIKSHFFASNIIVPTALAPNVSYILFSMSSHDEVMMTHMSQQHKMDNLNMFYFFIYSKQIYLKPVLWNY